VPTDAHAPPTNAPPRPTETAPKPTPPPTPLLVVEGVSKRFGITQALDNVSCTFEPGEVHALMGENGAGKSTLGKVISGLHKQDQGVVSLEGRELTPGSIDASFAAGVRIVHQELAQCPNLSVAENLCLQAIPRARFGLVDFRAMAARAERLVHPIEKVIDVRAPLGALSPGHRQICQIAAALDDGQGGNAVQTGLSEHGPRVIVFDEPTSSLSIAEVERLLQIVRLLADAGITVIYVSHRMGEIFACCDRVTVLRDGKYVATSRVADIDEPTLVEQMIGRRVEPLDSGASSRTPGGEAMALQSLAFESDALEPGDKGTAPDTAPDTANEQSKLRDTSPPSTSALLRVRNLSSPGKLRDVSLDVHAGEILGIGGLVGAGRSELLDAIFGLDLKARGDVRVADRTVRTGDARAMIRANVGYVPEDRRLQGLFFLLGIDENIVAPYMPRLASAGWRSRAAERRLVAGRMKEFQVKAASPASLPGELSGGNQQKLLLARWLADDTRVLLLDEPTRGIDVGTKAEIYRLVRAAAARGLAVLLVSSEMPELLALADRVIVMADGRVAGELAGDEMTQKNVLTLATREH